MLLEKRKTKQQLLEEYNTNKKILELYKEEYEGYLKALKKMREIEDNLYYVYDIRI